MSQLYLYENILPLIVYALGEICGNINGLIYATLAR